MHNNFISCCIYEKKKNEIITYDLYFNIENYLYYLYLCLYITYSAVKVKYVHI